MRPLVARFYRATIPVVVFLSAMSIHFLWMGFFPEKEPVQEKWVKIVPTTKPAWTTAYLDTQSYWVGYSYALALTFSVIALRRYLENKSCAAKNFAIGGGTLTGALVVAGCFLIGCCGSPMLLIYLNLFGVTFLQIAKPLLAGVTTLTVIFAWWLMNRKQAGKINTDLLSGITKNEGTDS